MIRSRLMIVGVCVWLFVVGDNERCRWGFDRLDVHAQENVDRAPAPCLETPCLETPGQTAARHARVSGRRDGTVIICHRGAVEFAHENTLEAFRAALELGADGNEIDIRRTRDGVLVCFHDDMLDMLLRAYGDASDYSWDELRKFPFRRPGAFGKYCRIPTLREVLELHRGHAGLLHLDIKRPDMDKTIAELLSKMDMWDHVMSAGANGEAIVKDPRYRPIGYKASLYLDRTETDSAVIARKLSNPGGAFIVEDPRGVLLALGRTIGPVTNAPVSPQALKPPPASGEKNRTATELVSLLNDDADWNQIAASEDQQAVSGRRITARARAADDLAKRDVRSPDVLKSLAQRVRNRSLHKHWRYHGLDGAAALRTLIQLKADKAVSLARFCLWRDDPALEAVRNPQYTSPRSWSDFRSKMVAFRELDRLPGKETEQLCRDYLALTESSARSLGPLQYEQAARVLLAIKPESKTAFELLEHSRSEVRGRCVLYCVAHADKSWARDVLRKKAPHALAFVMEPRNRR